jgi:signal transduction histidine kinase
VRTPAADADVAVIRGFVSDAASLLKRHPLDALIVLLAVVAEVKIWIAPGEGPRAVFIVGSLLWTLPLLLRHRFPFAAPVSAFAVQAGSAFADPTIGVETTATIALLVTFWVVGAGNEGSRALAGAAIGFSSVAVVAQVDDRVGLAEAVTGCVMGGVICLIAYALQRRTRLAVELEERTARLEGEREERTRAAVAEERRRIARELHDVIAHTVSVMTVQAGAARLLLDEEPERAAGPLLSVEESGRQALTEIQRLLGVLGEDEGEIAFGRQPGMADLDTLLEHARQAGLPVEQAVEGEPIELPPGVDLAAYRVVQEALTNALKHADPASAQVIVRFGREALDLEITNDGRTESTGDEGGHGLIGMRERISLYGGELHAGPEPGGYAVRARLPVEPAQR